MPTRERGDQQMYSGSCLCGQVKYEVEATFDHFYLCHCRHCQKDTGSAHAANLFSTGGQLVWTLGENKVKTFNLPSTQHMKSFCQECGAAVPSLQMDGKLLVVPAGSLDSVLELRPDAHIFYLSKAAWDSALETIKIYEKFPS